MPGPAKALCLFLSCLFVFYCDPFLSLLHAREFEGSPLRRATEETRAGRDNRPSKRSIKFFLVGSEPNSRVGFFETPVFTEWLQPANRRVLRSQTPFKWDFESRMVGSATPTETLSFAYDADGMRTAKSVNGVVTRFVLDKNRDYAQVLEERDATASIINVSYIYGDDLISQDRGASVSFYHYDGQLSTRQLTDGSAAITDSYTYDAFGVTLAQSGSTTNNYLYAGEQLDPNVGFYYLRARYLNQNVGRFLSSDPFPGLDQDPPTLHKYSYTAASPVAQSDPSGMFTLVERIVLAAILMVLALIGSSSPTRSLEQIKEELMVLNAFKLMEAVIPLGQQAKLAYDGDGGWTVHKKKVAGGWGATVMESRFEVHVDPLNYAWEDPHYMAVVLYAETYHFHGGIDSPAAQRVLDRFKCIFLWVYWDTIKPETRKKIADAHHGSEDPIFSSLLLFTGAGENPGYTWKPDYDWCNKHFR